VSRKPSRVADCRMRPRPSRVCSSARSSCTFAHLYVSMCILLHTNREDKKTTHYSLIGAISVLNKLITNRCIGHRRDQRRGTAQDQRHRHRVLMLAQIEVFRFHPPVPNLRSSTHIYDLSQLPQICGTRGCTIQTQRVRATYTSRSLEKS